MSQEAVQQPKTALERVEALEQSSQSLQSNFGNLLDTSRYLVDRSLSSDQALAGLAKTLAALVKALESKGVVTDSEVLSNIRLIDDDSNRERVADLVKNKIIETTEEIGLESLVVVTQKQIADDGSVTTRAGYRIIEIQDQNLNPEDRVNLIGKGVGAVLEHKGINNVSILTTVKEVYAAKKAGATPGEPQA